MMGTITMTDTATLVRLMAWLSPVFPTGSFAYSTGLEAAVQSGLIKNSSDLKNWLTALLELGTIKNDAIFLAQAWRDCDDEKALNELTNLALAMSGSAERYLETTAQSEAFSQAVRNWSQTTNNVIPSPCCLPIAIGVAAGMSHLPLSDTVSAFLHSIVTNQAQAAIRLSVMGQTKAAKLLADMESAILEVAQFAQNSTLDDLGSATVLAEISTMQHEELSGRMFRS